MKILVIIKSKHRQNTLKIAEAMAEAVPITICDVSEAENFDLNHYDIVGIGSGIYYGKFGKDIFEFVTNHLDDLSNVFVFSTSGKGKPENNDEILDYLNLNCKNVLGSFTCKGLCKWFIFGLVGGIAKGHPNEKDYEAAQTFIRQVLEKYNSSKAEI